MHRTRREELALTAIVISSTLAACATGRGAIESGSAHVLPNSISVYAHPSMPNAPFVDGVIQFGDKRQSISTNLFVCEGQVGPLFVIGEDTYWHVFVTGGRPEDRMVRELCDTAHPAIEKFKASWIR
jgi:hypothetical protein